MAGKLIPVTDLHCHILPGIDDGARDTKMSEFLLQSEKDQGVRQILFTPHFYADEIDVEGFIKRRNAAYEKMGPVIQKLKLKTSLGAEVRMQEELFDMDLSKMRLGDSHYLLLEWPFQMETYPIWGEDLVDLLLRQGIRPLFAHIDRYRYFLNDPDKLDHFMRKGCLFQINADSLLGRYRSSKVLSLIEKGYVHVIASDAHHPERRPVNLIAAMDCAADKLGGHTADYLLRNADAIYRGLEIYPMEKSRKRHFFDLF